jgi:hypothetical protein
LSETKVPPSIAHDSLLQLSYPFMIHAPPSSLKGGMVVARKLGVEVKLINQNHSQVSCIVYSDPFTNPWLLTCFHAPHGGSKALLWDSLSKIGNSFGGLWLNLGDFNAILSPHEKLGGKTFGSSPHYEFCNFVHSNGLVDLGYDGNPYTWCNKRSGCALIKERLDRGLATKDWILLFPNASLKHFSTVGSDHNPIFVDTVGSYSKLPKPFRFESFWVRDPSSFLVIGEAWDPQVGGSDAFSFKQSLKSTKLALKDWNLSHFGNIHFKLKSLLAAVDAIQREVPSLDNSIREEGLQLAIQEELSREEILWKLKSRELWFSCRNLNTKFFHAPTLVRRRYNSINCIKIDNGSFLYNRNDIGSHLVSYFHNLFSSSSPVLDSNLDNLFEPSISSSENDLFCKVPDASEIYQAVKDLWREKAPRPDGMTGHFYQTYWDTVKKSVIRFIQSFFRNGHFPRSFNHTNLLFLKWTTLPKFLNFVQLVSPTSYIRLSLRSLLID